MLRKSIVYSLIFSFCFLLVPTNYWHSCDEHQHDTSKKTGLQLNEKDCFICDFELFPAELEQTFYFIPLALSYPRFVTQVTKLTCNSPELSQLRGPPCI